MNGVLGGWVVLGTVCCRKYIIPTAGYVLKAVVASEIKGTGVKVKILGGEALCG